MPDTMEITPQHAIQPTNNNQTIIQSPALLNKPRATPISKDDRSRPMPLTILLTALVLVFRYFSKRACGLFSSFRIGSYLSASARATVSKFVPQARQNLTSSRFCAAHRGQNILATSWLGKLYDPAPLLGFTKCRSVTSL